MRFLPKSISTHLLPQSYFPRKFWIVSFIKLLCGVLFASHYVTKGFLPFDKYFINTGLNPYDYFLHHATVVFPYPAGMLYLLSIFLGLGNILTGSIFSNTWLSLLFFRIPILIADIVIYVVLCKLLPAKENKVFWLYYLSPVLIYINYFHGQLDVIPTAFLFLSLYFLSIKNLRTAFLLLGIGIATKTHLMIVLPFYAIYLLRQKIQFISVALLSLLSFFVFIAINIPLYSHSFVITVFNNVEQQRIFLTTIPYLYKDLTIFVAPAALLVCLYIFASSNRRMNFDSLILTLGLIFTILIALVPPMQGWFYWSIPLFTFFLIKYKDSHLFSFLMMNIFFIAFFLFTKDSDIFESSSVSFPFLATLPTPFLFLQNNGINALQIQNILFTGLQVSVAMNAYWCYRLGIYYNNLYIEKQKAFVVGIGGDSGVGKSTLTEGIAGLAGKKQTVVLNGDDSHKWERNNNNWEYFTHLDPKANNIHKDVNQIYALVDGKTIERATYSHKTGKFTKPSQIEKDQFIVFQGLHPFFLERMRNAYDLKIFIDTEEELRQQWKMQRDVKFRGHTLTKVIHDIERRKKDAAKFILPQKKLADWIIHYYRVKDLLCVKYTFSNSIPLEELLTELSLVKGLTIKHQYSTKIQTVFIEGKISKRMIEKIAYKLYPNLHELTNNPGDFQENIKGINQLFFINYLNYYFINNRVVSVDRVLN